MIELLTQRGLDQYMARDIVDALRNGLAHTFDTKLVQVGGKQVELVVSWGAEEHLRSEADPPRLYLNVRTMWEDLRQSLAACDGRLQSDPAWAERVPDDWKKRWVRQSSPRARPAWEARFDP